MKIIKINELKKRIQNYEIIIFDLDDTIYSQKHYDTPALKKVADYLSKILKIKFDKIFSDIRNLKKLKRGKHPLLIFNKYLNEKILNIKLKKKIIKNSVKIFQSYNCKNLKSVPSLKFLLKKIIKKKILFLVTNGNIERQRRKIKNLSISRYFKRIFILDGVKKSIKPSILSVKYLTIFLKKNSNKKAVYIGDNNISDRLFAKNLKIKFINFEFNTRN